MQQINSPEDLKKLLDYQKETIRKIASAEAQKIAEEVVENELDLFEFNLFISSIGKEKLNEATKKVHELRKKVDSGKIDLTKYEEMAEEFD